MYKPEVLDRLLRELHELNEQRNELDLRINGVTSQIKKVRRSGTYAATSVSVPSVPVPVVYADSGGTDQKFLEILKQNKNQAPTAPVKTGIAGLVAVPLSKEDEAKQKDDLRLAQLYGHE